MDYVRIEAVARGNAAHFRHLENFEDDFELLEGISLQDTFPEDAAYRMSDDFPDNLELHEVLHNLDEQLVVGGGLRTFLSEQGVDGVEYLPVKIINHKGRTVPADYFLVNILRHIDAIDQGRTQFEWNPLDPELMKKVKNLTLDEQKIDPDALLFRLKHLTSVILLRRDLADKMAAAGFKGFKITEIAAYKW